MIALERLANALSEMRSVQIDPRRCLPCRSPRADCTACADICPEGAISLGRSPSVKECSTCGLCAAACQADAIRLDAPSDQELLRRFAQVARKQSRLTLACSGWGPMTAEGPDLSRTPDAVVVGCLGRLTPELLLAAAGCGFGEVLLLEPAECGACIRSAGMDRLREAIAAAQTLLAGLGQACLIRLQPPAAAQPPQTAAANFTTSSAALPVGGGSRRSAAPPVYAERRAFLLSALGLLRQALPAAPQRQAPDLFTPSTSRRREILLWALEQLAPETVSPGLTWGEAAVHLAGTCHQCAVCVRLCPNGALALDENGLRLNPQQCHACGLCTQVCPTASLALGPPRALGLLRDAEPLPLGSPHSIRCTHCGAEEQVVCPAERSAQAERPTPESLCLPCAMRASAARRATEAAAPPRSAETLAARSPQPTPSLEVIYP